jgi:diaminopimelate decarboxylase
MDKVSFHGNNKSAEELKMAVENHVGVIMLDNFHEIELLSKILNDLDTQTNVMLRITPGISAHTHEYDQTGQVDSKFGFDVESKQAEKALEIVLNNPRMNMLGIHAHIGSQIFEVNGFVIAAEKLVDLSADWHQKFGYQPEVLNVGGGFGIKYSEEDDPIAPEKFVDAIVKAIKQRSNQKGLNLPAIWIYIQLGLEKMFLELNLISQ